MYCVSFLAFLFARRRQWHLGVDVGMDLFCGTLCAAVAIALLAWLGIDDPRRWTCSYGPSAHCVLAKGLFGFEVTAALFVLMAG